MRRWIIVNVETVIESAARDHKALLATEAGNKEELQKAFAALKDSLDSLTRDVAELAFQGGRSKRKQWADIQKDIADLLDDGRSFLEKSEPAAPDADLSEKMDRRYQRIQSRIIRLSGS